MESVLIISSSDKSLNFLFDLLKATSYSQITIAKSGGEARRLVNQNDYDIVIINTPLSDEFGHELALSVTEKSNSGIILMVRNEIADDISAKVEKFGVFVVAKPISLPFFHQALKLVSASRQRMMGLETKNIALKSKIEEIRLVDRAKCVLIQYLNMTEPQAHRYIEKQAMDMRQTKREIAQCILKTYET